jgi:hypothetical protein
MADRDDKTATQPLEQRGSKVPEVNVRDGSHVATEAEARGAEPPPAAANASSRDASGTPIAEGAPVRERSVSADEVMMGDRHEAALAEAARPPQSDAHHADHTASTPSGSDRTGIEVPKTDRSRKLLMGAVAAVVVILLLMFLLPGIAGAARILGAA